MSSFSLEALAAIPRVVAPTPTQAKKRTTSLPLATLDPRTGMLDYGEPMLVPPASMARVEYENARDYESWSPWLWGLAAFAGTSLVLVAKAAIGARPR